MRRRKTSFVFPYELVFITSLAPRREHRLVWPQYVATRCVVVCPQFSPATWATTTLNLHLSPRSLNKDLRLLPQNSPHE